MVVEKLEPVHVVLPLIGADPDCVDSADGNASDGEKDAQGTHGLDWRSCNDGCWLVVVGNQGHAETHGNQSVDCHSRDGFLVEEEIDDGNNGGEEDPGDLIKGNGGDLEGDVHADDVHCHCDGEGKHVHDGDFARLKHAHLGAGEEVERCSGDEEMKGREGGLTLREGFVAEDGFIAEDLMEKRMISVDCSYGNVRNG